MNLPLTDKYALITGSSKGVGLAAARLFAAQGARVVMHANTAVNAARVEAEAIGPQVLGVIAADLSQAGAGTRLFAEADALAHGRLDIVVNNAGIYLANELGADDEQWHLAWASVLQVNLLALADISRAAVRAFVSRGGGSLINIASRAGYRGDDGMQTAGHGVGSSVTFRNVWRL